MHTRVKIASVRHDCPNFSLRFRLRRPISFRVFCCSPTVISCQLVIRDRVPSEFTTIGPSLSMRMGSPLTWRTVHTQLCGCHGARVHFRRTCIVRTPSSVVFSGFAGPAAMANIPEEEEEDLTAANSNNSISNTKSLCP